MLEGDFSGCPVDKTCASTIEFREPRSSVLCGVTKKKKKEENIVLHIFKKFALRDMGWRWSSAFD